MKHMKTISIAALLSGMIIPATNQISALPLLQNDTPTPFSFETWRAGQQANEPDFHVQSIDANTLVIRQSLRDTFEAPFMYLIFGMDKAVLIDTGVKSTSLRRVIDREIDIWLSANQKSSIELIVMHSHGHGDHVGNDYAFKSRPNTIVVGHKPEEVAKFFSIADWPTDLASLELGGRSITVIPTPGHHPSHVMVHDPMNDILFSGDMIYPGKLYFQCAKADTYMQSLNRIIEYAEKEDIKWLLGGHIELPSNSNTAFPFNQKSRENEHQLALPVDILNRIRIALNDMSDELVVKEFQDFTLFPHPATPQGKQPPNWCNE
ncbi:MBL fold metallo-hydrolase [Kordiimonas sp. SCSIO 12610]|uniref:MBL fold metallo-hydrolase n=1 Tax=Kordiimonas sp. SCSIO 12610 TaxID=2829597 RepID=UPI00210C7849|nr:MBL fold metallo-hydrolase [Kordiimonas sp. SCSIO 12610]UTW54006.1 MBL fold metallo-hydrolase [Kordiimonas sp. SCSIO 12610]